VLWRLHHVGSADVHFVFFIGFISAVICQFAFIAGSNVPPPRTKLF